MALQVVVDVRRRHIAVFTVLVDILEELLSWQVLAGTDDLGDAPVTHLTSTWRFFKVVRP